MPLPRSNWVLILILSAIVFLAHLPIISAALGLVDSDMGWNLVEADRFRNGEWPLFYNGLWYSGTTWGIFRALTVGIFENIQILGGYLSGQFFFSYVLTPWLLILSAFFFLTKAFDRKVAFWTSIILAFGFHAWNLRLGLDWYFATLTLGTILLAFRTRLENPFLNLSEKSLFWLAALSGLSIYTGRFALIYVLIFWVPIDRLLKEAWLWIRLKRLSTVDRVLRGFAWVFLGLFLYLEIFGHDVGVWWGKTVRLHSSPNLDFAILAFLIWWLRRHWNFLKRKRFFYKRLGLFAGGLFLGLSREIYAVLFENLPETTRLWGRNSFEEVLGLIAKIPHAFTELTAGAPTGWHHFSVLLFVWGIGTLFLRPRLRPFLFLGLLCLIAFLRIRPHTPGDPRYLLPLFPFLFLALGSLISFAFETKKLWIQRSLLFLIFFHLAHQLAVRDHWIESPQRFANEKKIKKVLESFQSEGLKLFISDEYHECNQYTLASNRSLACANDGLYPKFVEERLQSNSKIGVLLTRTRVSFEKETPIFTFRNRRYRLRYLRRVGFEPKLGLRNLTLYVGNEIKPTL